MSKQVSSYLNVAILSFEENFLRSLCVWRLVSKDWCEWSNSHQYLQTIVIETLRKGWHIRNTIEETLEEFAIADSLDIQPFRCDLFNFKSSGNEAFYLASKYIALTRIHLKRMEEAVFYPDAIGCNDEIKSRNPNQLVNMMSSIITPFLFLYEVKGSGGPYYHRDNLAIIKIGNVRGENKFVELKYTHSRCDSSNQMRNVIFYCLDFESGIDGGAVGGDGSHIEIPIDEYSAIFFSEQLKYNNKTMRIDTGTIVEVMKFIGLSKKMYSNQDCIDNFFHVVIYELIAKKLFGWYVEYDMFNDENKHN